MKDDVARLLRDLPLVGSTADQAAYRVKESLKQLLQPSTIFETFLEDRKSTRLNSSHQIISYAVFCLKKKKKSWHNKYTRHPHSTHCNGFFTRPSAPHTPA